METRLFYPVSRIHECQADIAKKTHALLRKPEGTRVVNVVGPSSVGKSSSMGGLAQFLSSEQGGRRIVGWWNCQPEFDIRNLMRSSLAQVHDPDVVSAWIREYGPGFSLLQVQGGEPLVNGLVSILEKQEIVLFLDDFDQVSADSTIAELLRQVASKSRGGAIVLVSREPMGTRLGLPLGQRVTCLGTSPTDWRVARKAALDLLGDEAKPYLGDTYFSPQIIERLRTALLTARANDPPVLTVDEFHNDPEVALDAFFAEFLRIRYGDSVCEFLLDLALLQGPRSLRMFWGLADKHSIPSAAQAEVMTFLERATLVSSQTTGKALQKEPWAVSRGSAPLEEDWASAREQDGLFHLATEFGHFVRSRAASERIADAHLRVAHEFEQLLERRMANHAGTANTVVASHILDIGAAIDHYFRANKPDLAWDLLRKRRDLIEKQGEVRLLYGWVKNASAQLRGETARESLIELCRIARKINDVDGLERHCQAIKGVVSHVGDPWLKMFEGIVAIDKMRMEEAWNLLNMALNSARTQSGQKDAPGLARTICLDLCRLALMRSRPADFRRMLVTLSLQVQQGNQLTAEDQHQVCCFMAEYSLLLGFPFAGVEWAKRARTYAEGDALREAIGFYWMGRTQVCRAQLVSQTCLAKTSVSAANSLLGIPEYADAAEEARQSSVQANEAFKRSGSVDVWWGLELGKLDAYVQRVNLNLDGALETIERVKALYGKQMENSRNLCHVRLLELEVLLEQYISKGASNRALKERASVVAQSLFPWFMGHDRDTALPELPNELARVLEARAYFGDTAETDRANALRIYLANGLLSSAGRCLALQSSAAGASGSAVPPLQYYAQVLAPENFLSRCSPVGNDPLGEAMAVRPLHLLPRRWPPDEDLDVDCLGIPQEMLRDGIDDTAKRIEREVKAREQAKGERSKDLGREIGRHFNQLHSVARSLAEMRDQVALILAGGGMRNHPRTRCTQWECSLTLRRNRKWETVLYPGSTVDLSISGLLIRLALPNAVAAAWQDPSNSDRYVDRNAAVKIKLGIRGPRGVIQWVELDGQVVNRPPSEIAHALFPFDAESPFKGEYGLPLKFEEKDVQRMRKLDCPWREECVDKANCYFGFQEDRFENPRQPVNSIQEHLGASPDPRGSQESPRLVSRRERQKRASRGGSRRS